MPVICVTVSKSTSLIATLKSYMAYVPAVLLTVGIAVLSLWENPHVPHSLQVSDKVMHGLMYTMLAVAWMAPVANRRPTVLAGTVVCLAVTFYGALLEWLQHTCTTTRSGEWLDVAADWAGAALGVVVTGLVCWLWRKHTHTTSH